MQTISLNSKGDDVKTWQQIIGVSADGVFGPATDSVTKTWQTKHNIEADGVVGPATWLTALKGYTIKQGSTGPIVQAWQRTIGVTADGIFGSGTAKATRNWQTSHGITSDGIVGPQTWTVAIGTGGSIQDLISAATSVITPPIITSTQKPESTPGIVSPTYQLPQIPVSSGSIQLPTGTVSLQTTSANATALANQQKLRRMYLYAGIGGVGVLGVILYLALRKK